MESLAVGERERAVRLHREAVVVNALDSTHIAQGDGEYIKKLRESGVTATNHTIAATEGMAEAMQAIVNWRHVYEGYPDDVIIGHTFDDILRAKREGKVAVFFGFQDTAPMEGYLHMFDIYYRLGIRFVQLTYQRRNLVGDGCGEPSNAGLSRFGTQVVKELNRLGMIIDLSHVGTRTTLETIELSEDPVVVSHAGVRRIRDTVRNKTDEEIRALASRGGVIGIPPKSGFLKAGGLAEGTTMADYVAHIDYVVSLVGVDYVGIGTDVGDERKYTKNHMGEFRRVYPEVDIVDDSLRVDIMHTMGLESPSELHNITSALVARGYGEEDIRKVIGGNFLRVFQQVWSGSP